MNLSKGGNKYPQYSSLFASSASGYSSYYATENMVNDLYKSETGSVPGISILKGEFGEKVMRRIVPGLLNDGEYDFRFMSPHYTGRSGIDGLFIDPKNKINYVVEAKTFSSKLNLFTEDGKQMSSRWVESRLANTIKEYSELSERVKSDGIGYNNKPDDVIKDWTIPTSEGKEIKIFKTPKGIITDDPDLTPFELSGEVDNGANSLSKHSALIFKFTYDKSNHWVIKLVKLNDVGDVYGNPIAEKSGKFSEFSNKLQNDIKQSIQETLLENGFKEKHINDLVEKCANDPAYFKELTDSPDLSVTYGLLESLEVGFGGAGLSAIFSFLIQSKGGGYSKDKVKFAWKKGIAVGSSIALGSYSGVWFTETLENSAIGDSIVENIGEIIPISNIFEGVLGAIGGATIAGISFNLINVVLSGGDSRQLQRGLTRFGFKLGASGLATSMTVSGVTAFATASTGTPIASLYGIAAKNATMAWLGGGSIKSGGFGMAVGKGVLCGIWGVVGVAVFIGVGYAYSLLDEFEKQRFLFGKIDISKEMLNK